MSSLFDGVFTLCLSGIADAGDLDGEIRRAQCLRAQTPHAAPGAALLLSSLKNLLWEKISAAPDAERETTPERLERLSRTFDSIIAALISSSCNKMDAEFELASEKFLRERTKLDRVVEIIGAGICLLDGDLNVKWINRRMESWVGRGEPLHGTPCPEHMGKLLGCARECSPRKVFETGAPVQTRTRVACADGVERTLELACSPITDAAGAVTQALITARDVTEDLKIRERERFWREFNDKVITNAQVGIIAVDDDMRIVVWNRYMEEEYDIPAAEVLGKDIYDFFPAIKGEGWPEWIERVRSTGKPVIIQEWRHKTKKKGERIIHAAMYPLHDFGGEFIGAGFINLDVTQRIEMENELRNTKDFFRNVFDSSTDSIVITGLDGTIINANLAGRKTLGDEKPEGKNFDAFFARRGAFAEILERLKSGEPVENVELDVRGAGSGTFTFLLTSIILRDAEGKPLGVLARGADVTEMKRIRERLDRTRRLHALGEMASGVAHDFNNLLAVIIGRTHMLSRQTGNEHLLRGLAVIERAARHAVEIVSRIQSFARKKPDSLEFKPLDINEVVAEAVELVRPRLRQDAAAGGAISVTFNRKKAPPVNGNPHELIEVFTNLLLNAADAMPKGGKITVAAAALSDSVKVTVSDTGGGIESEVVDRIFDPFFTTKGVKGMGLGLSVSYGIVERHGGTIEVKSVPGRGTTFTVTLPAAAGETERERFTPPAAVAKQPASVLVVDDDGDLLELIADVLEADGCEVTAARNGEEAVRLAGQRAFDAVLTDLRMPGMDGFEVVKRVKSAAPGTPAALITGWPSMVTDNDIERTGIDALIVKPFSPDEIRSFVKKAGTMTRSRNTPGD
ncbi:MAG: PAS domain-containing protein [bacterium]